MQEIRKNLKDHEISGGLGNFRLFYRRHTLYVIKNHENSQCNWQNFQASFCNNGIKEKSQKSCNGFLQISSKGEVYTTMKNTYNKIAPHFDATRQKTWKEVEIFIDSQPKGTLILDLASGTGRHSLYAKNHRLNPVAGDFSISQLRTLRKKDKTIPLVMLDLTALPFRPDTFESIICIAAIHHLETEKERIAALKEAEQILKPQSPILISAWAHDQPRFKNNPPDIHHTWDKKHPRFYHLFKTGELEGISKKANLQPVKSFRIKDNIYVHSRKTKQTTGADTT